jgi:hypothetical protein
MLSAVKTAIALTFMILFIAFAVISLVAASIRRMRSFRDRRRRYESMSAPVRDTRSSITQFRNMHDRKASTHGS